MVESNNYFLRRILEISPAASSWTALFFPLIFSFYYPSLVAIFVLGFDLYWLFKAVLMGVHTYIGYLHIKEDEQIDWFSRCQRLISKKEYLKEISTKLKELRKESFFWLRLLNKKKFLKYKKYKREFHDFSQIKEELIESKSFKDIWQVIILAVYKEDKEIVFPSINSYVKANWPKDKMILVLALEKRAQEHCKKISNQVLKRYSSSFYKVLVSFHPDNLPGEIKAKGANVTYAAKYVLKPFLDKEKIPYSNVLVSTFDADTRVHSQYFASLAFKYLITEDRERRSYQPIPIYSNNIWNTPSLMRVVAFGASFWQMIESTRSYRLVNFSSHAMPFSTLVEINFWDKMVVNEDSRQFWRAFFKFNGNHKAIPVFIPVYMDAVLAENYWKTIKNQYKQKQRWAYGVEHFPYVVIESLRNKKISFWKKIIWIGRMFEGYFSWATASIFIATAGWMPLLLNPQFKFEVISLSFPVLVSRILTISWIGIIGSMIISLKLLPPPPRELFPKKGRHNLRYFWKKFIMGAQWIFLPFVALFLGSIPALDAQTRLAMGRYLQFHLTEKSRFLRKNPAK